MSAWAKKYGDWIDWELDKLLPNGVELEAEFNHIGVSIVEKLKQEIEGDYKIKFMPSTSARFYATK